MNKKFNIKVELNTVGRPEVIKAWLQEILTNQGYRIKILSVSREDPAEPREALFAPSSYGLYPSPEEFSDESKEIPESPKCWNCGAVKNFIESLCGECGRFDVPSTRKSKEIPESPTAFKQLGTETGRTRSDKPNTLDGWTNIILKRDPLTCCGALPGDGHMDDCPDIKRQVRMVLNTLDEKIQWFIDRGRKCDKCKAPMSKEDLENASNSDIDNFIDEQFDGSNMWCLKCIDNETPDGIPSDYPRCSTCEAPMEEIDTDHFRCVPCFEKELKTRIANALRKTWAAIAEDVDTFDKTMDRRQRLEIILDANHIANFGGLTNEDLKFFQSLKYSDLLDIALKSGI